jgi:hypothetical protein
LETLTDAVKAEVKNYIEGIKRQGKLEEGDPELDLLRDRWDQYTDAFVNSAYDIFLNKANQNSLVNKALQQVKTVDGVNVIDVNGNVSWKALIKHGNPDTIVMAVKDLFEKGIREDNGSVTVYTPPQAQRIGEYFRKIYMDKLNAAKARELNNSRAKNASPANIISDFLKDRGFFSLVKDKEGNLLLSQSDWAAFLFEVRSQIGTGVGNNALKAKVSGIDFVQNKLGDFLDKLKDEKGNDKFNDYQKQVIKEKLIDVIVAKLKPGTNDAADIERLIALDTINKGNAFNAETQHAVNKVVGVSDLSQSVLDQIRQLTKTAQQIINYTTGAAPNGNGQMVNRGAYAFQAMAEIDRKIKTILREHAISKSNQQMIAKYLADIMGGGTVSLLLNPNNAIENVATQIGTNIAESFNLLVTDRKLYRQTFGKFNGAFWKAWWNYASGGASNELANEGELTNELQSSERLRAKAWIKEFKSGPKGVAGAILKSPAYAVSIVSRFLMNSFDAATTVSLMRKRMLQSTYQALIEQGRTPAEVRGMLLQAIELPQSVQQEIKVENERIRQLLVNAGVFVTDAMMKQNESDMFLSAYESVLQNAATTAGATMKQATEVTKALTESAQMQAKSLGGKKQLMAKDIFSMAIYGATQAALWPQKSLFKASREAESRGEFNRAARLQFAGTVWQTAIGKFVSGVANFMNLAISATPLGAAQVY